MSHPLPRNSPCTMCRKHCRASERGPCDFPTHAGDAKPSHNRTPGLASKMKYNQRIGAGKGSKDAMGKGGKGKG